MATLNCPCHSVYKKKIQERVHDDVVVKAVCYKPKGHGFETRSGDFFFFFPIYLILLAALGSGVYSASNLNEYQKQNRKCF
jgi:hypothetical protein